MDYSLGTWVPAEDSIRLFSVCSTDHRDPAKVSLIMQTCWPVIISGMARESCFFTAAMVAARVD